MHTLPSAACLSVRRQSSDLGASEVAASEDEGGGFRGASTASTTSSLASGNDNVRGPSKAHRLQH